MKWKGKIIGFMIGSFWGAPGVMFGLIIGQIYDMGLLDRRLGKYRSSHKNTGQYTYVQKLFFDSSFSIMGFIAKSDGRVSQQEIDVAQRIMEQLNFSTEMKSRAIQEFNRGKHSDFDAQACLTQLKRSCLLHPRLLKTFLDIQIQIAYAEGALTSAKRAALHQVFRSLGLSAAAFNQFDRQFRAGQHYSQHQYQGQKHSSSHLHDAYVLLGISANASNAEIKKAYRRLMSKHHPDKLISQGVPPEMIKLATQQTQQIKRAYETIKQVRGF